MSRIVLISGDADFDQRLRSAVDASHVRTVSLGQAAEALDGLGAPIIDATTQVVLVGPGLRREHTVPLVEAVDRQHPDVSVVVVARPTQKLVESVLRAGARDIVSPDAETAELLDATERASEIAQRRRSAHTPEPAPEDRHRTFVVLSAKGGSGKTVVASNLAATLGRAAPGDVGLLDLDVQFGDVRYTMGLEPKFSLMDVIRRPNELDATQLKGYLEAHDSGAFVLCPPESPIEGDSIEAGQVAQTIGRMSEAFRYLVVDTAGGIDEIALQALDQATDIVLVVSHDVVGVRAAQKTTKILADLGYQDRFWHVVVNRLDHRTGLDLEDVEMAIGMRADLILPATRAVPLAANEGQTVVEADPRSAVAKRMAEFVQKLLPEAEKQPRTSWFSRRKGASS